jgi:hypothetical protein
MYFEKLKIPTYFTSKGGKHLALTLSAGSEGVSGFQKYKPNDPVIRRFVFHPGYSK